MPPARKAAIQALEKATRNVLAVRGVDAIHAAMTAWFCILQTHRHDLGEGIKGLNRATVTKDHDGISGSLRGSEGGRVFEGATLLRTYWEAHMRRGPFVGIPNYAISEGFKPSTQDLELSISPNETFIGRLHEAVMVYSGWIKRGCPEGASTGPDPKPSAIYNLKNDSLKFKGEKKSVSLLGKRSASVAALFHVLRGGCLIPSDDLLEVGGGRKVKVKSAVRCLERRKGWRHLVEVSKVGVQKSDSLDFWPR